MKEKIIYCQICVLLPCTYIQQTFSIIQFLNKTMVWWHIYHVTIIYRMCQCIRDTTENNTFHLTKASSLGTMFTLWPNSIFHWDFLPIEFIGLYRYRLIWKKAHQLYTDNSHCSVFFIWCCSLSSKVTFFLKSTEGKYF